MAFLLLRPLMGGWCHNYPFNKTLVHRADGNFLLNFSGNDESPNSPLEIASDLELNSSPVSKPSVTVNSLARQSSLMSIRMEYDTGS